MKATEILESPIQTITLYYRQGSSDKVYQAAIERDPSGDGFLVNFAFGRRGSTLQSGTKTPAPVDHAAAEKIFQKLVREKTAKGYTPGDDGTPYQNSSLEERSTGILPQLLNPISEEDLETYLADPRWWMQEKFYGRRLLVRKQDDQITAINRKGLTVALPMTIASAVLSIGASSCLLDGEAVGEVFHAFDLLEKGELSLRTNSYATRYEQLVDLIDSVQSNHVRYALTATEPGEKRAMLQSLRHRRREGAVFKDRTAPYTPGRPNTGGPQLKLKFYATASCIVAGTNPAKRSVMLELIDRRKRLPVGNVTIPANHPVPGRGQVVEVRYLYAYPNGSLYQPVYLGCRDDADREDCRVDQLKFKAESEEE